MYTINNLLKIPAKIEVNWIVSFREKFTPVLKKRRFETIFLYNKMDLLYLKFCLKIFLKVQIF